jgi:DNA-binding MarR family transcriptional regulator
MVEARFTLMAGTSEDTLDMIIRFCYENQINEAEGEKKNYPANIAEELDLDPHTVLRGINWLESWGWATSTNRGPGRRRIVRVLPDENAPKLKGETEDK